MLAVLALEVNRVVAVDSIVDRVWNDDPPPKARAVLQSYVTRLRNVLGAEISYRSGGYVLSVDADSVDLHRFRRLRAEGELEEALELWHGEPLAGLDGDWAARMREVLRAERLAAQRLLLDAQLASGDDRNLLPRLDELLAAHPLDEQLIGHRMLALHRAGRRAEALACYREARERLLDEIGDEPGEALRTLHQRLLRGDSTLSLGPAVHRTIVVVDVEGFSRRTNAQQLAVRDVVYRALREAFDTSGIPWDVCHHEDRGDGVLVLIPPDVPKSGFVEAVPGALVKALRQQDVRLRMAVHAGEVNFDAHGVAAAAVNLTFRLVDSTALKTALAESPGVLAVLVSAWFHEDVVRHSAVAHAFHQVRVTSKETDVAAWLHLPDQAHPAPRPVPRQLPRHTPNFVGRAAELRDLSPRPGTVVITGTAGVGKTTLALRWAHEVADRFPDGQLHVNLRGFDRSGPVPADEAVRGFLSALEVPPEKVPVDEGAQSALLRSLLADRKMMLLLDNARDSDHVRSLLPGGRHCLTVVTSRDSLTGLVVHEGARPVTLDVLSDDEATVLITRTVGERATAEPEAVSELVRLCARLPLAVSIVAARAALRPKFPLHALVSELERERLDALDAGDLRTVFRWSYQQLAPETARVFRLLGLHPGPDVSAEAIAAMAGAPRPALRELTAGNLVQEHVPGRFTCHDLLRAFAQELMGEEPDAERRMFDHYLQAARAADLALPDARAWFAAEHQVLLAVVARAADRGFYAHAWQIYRHTRTFLQREGHWHDLVTTGLVALEAVGRTGDHAGRACTHSGLAFGYVRLGAHDVAEDHLRQALRLWDELGDRAGQASTHLEHTWMFCQRDDYHRALVHARLGLDLYAAEGDRGGQANALNDIGWCHTQLGDHAEALTSCTRALELHHEVGDRQGEAATWDSIGLAHHHLGDHEKALAAFGTALDLFRELGVRYDQAVTLAHLSDTHRACGDEATADERWRQALVLLEGLHHPGAARLVSSRR